jgi:alpha-ribazole phosphatase
MKTVYLVRHGESLVNVHGEYFVDDERAPLTAKGEEQSRFLAGRFKQIAFDVIISSPFERTMRTAEFITKETGHVAEYNALFGERLLPVELIGKMQSDAEARALADRAMRSSEKEGSEKIGRTETFEEIHARAAAALRYLEERPEEKIVVVSHGFFSRMLIAHMLYGETLTSKEFQPMVWGWRTKNTGISMLHFDPQDRRSSWWMSAWNDHAHLG